MSTTSELLNMLEDETLSLRTDMLMLRLFDDRNDIPASQEVIEDYVDRVRCYLDQHRYGVSVYASALCDRLDTSQSIIHVRAVG